MKNQIKLGITFAVVGLLIASFKNCKAQDVIYTKQGGIIKNVKLISDDGDTLKYVYSKTDKADFILKADVKDYKKKNTDNIKTNDYRENVSATQQKDAVSIKYTPIVEDLDHLNEASNAFVGFVVSSPIASIIASVTLLVGAPIIATYAILGGGLVFTIVYVAKFVKELRLAGKEFYYLRSKVK